MEKAIREHEPRPRGTLAEAFARIRAGDVDGLRPMLDADPTHIRTKYSGAATTLPEAVAQPGVFGEHLEIELGVDPDIVRLLIDRGSELDVSLNLAACFNRAELVQMLLVAGADPMATQIWGITPQQTAVYHGATAAASLLAAVAVGADVQYVAAGATTTPGASRGPQRGVRIGSLQRSN